jgi:hypothetical protein
MKSEDERPGMFQYEQYWMMLLPAVFIIGLIATLISVSIFGYSDAARRTHCEAQVRVGNTPEPWCAPFLNVQPQPERKQ